ncbi:glycosyltransferase family 2 protein [Longitalea luteola]|uniref:glycosyltransferase family 2 protein n=1 Tax=Longitalea luteola TaxID=2812563 RepID=UPI001A960172|nr:glycosyltransferase family A protein [Longitalea luteola]
MPNQETQPGLISVVIPCFNQGKFIDDAVESVYQQTYTNYEIVIVDAGSDDPFTKEKLRNYKAPFTQVVTSAQQIFPSRARNLAFSHTKGEFILTLDADDILEKTFMEKTMAGMATNPEAGAVSGKVMYFGYEEGFLDYRGGQLEDILRNMGSHLCALIRRTAWEEINGFDETVNDGFEDWEFWMRMTKEHWSIVIVPEILFYYRQKDSSRVTEVFKNQTQLIEQLKEKHKEVYAHPFNYLKAHLKKTKTQD